MLCVICDAIDREVHAGRPCQVIRAYRSDREIASPGRDRIMDICRRLKYSEPAEPSRYPAPPVRITIEGDPRNVLAEEMQVYELSVGVTSFAMYVYGVDDCLAWMVGKTLYIEAEKTGSPPVQREGGLDESEIGTLQRYDNSNVGLN